MNTRSPEKHLILGGARSGKSSYAERIASDISEASSLPLIYLATATAGDTEMERRISKHQLDRHDGWQLLEEPLLLPSAISAIEVQSTILIDCLTLWVSNCLHQAPQQWSSLRDQMIDLILSSDHNILMVSNEVGSGIIPMGELTRDYVDNVGWLHQELAKVCNRVTLVTAGLPRPLKSSNVNTN